MDRDDRARNSAPLDEPATSAADTTATMVMADGEEKLVATITQPGATIQHYEIIRPLGQGGMGQVFLARDTELGRLVAMKFLARVSGTRAQRFLAEARVTARLDHDNVVTIYEIGQHVGCPYMVLEYVRGQSLRNWLRERRARHHIARQPGTATGSPASPAPVVSPSRAVELMIPVVAALVRAHELGIVHRDLKPSNIMVTDSGSIKVLDFGIAKVIPADEADSRSDVCSGSPGADPGGAPALGGSIDITKTGHRVGTRAYMSPEQWSLGAVDHRSDIWSVGLLLYELALGHHPLAPLSKSALATVRDLAMPMPSAREQGYPLGKLGSIIDRSLIKNKEDRIGSARQLLAELEAIARPRPRSSDEEYGNPYNGLAAFQERDADRFFGRSQDILHATTRILENPVLAIVGPSGVGKSSFARAGLIPALKRSGEPWEAFAIRPGPHPMAGLAELALQCSRWTSSHSLEGPLFTTTTGDEPLGDRDKLRARLVDEPGCLGVMLRSRAHRRLEHIAIFIDQFEELYTMTSDDERQAFLACLSGVADDVASPLRVVLAIRSDFLDRMAAESAAITELASAGMILLRPLEADGLRDALLRPLHAMDYRFESEELMSEMLAPLAQSVAALPLLQFTAAKLWETRDRGQRVITEAGYREIGGIAGALAGHANAVVGAMSAREKTLTRAIFLRLVTPERTRALAAMGELRQLAGATAEELERTLGRLIDARLLAVQGSGPSESTVEFVHESLLDRWPTLAQWLAESEGDAAFRARLRNAAGEWEKSGYGDGLLWRGQAAGDAQRFLDRHRDDVSGELSRSEERYLTAVVAMAERSHRQRRRAAIGVIASLAMIATVLAYLTVRSEREAARAENEAERAEIETARAQLQAARARNATRMATAREHREDPTTVLALLREVERPEPPRGWSALAKWAVQAEIAQYVLTHSDQVNRAELSPDGTRIVSAADGGLVQVWNADGRGEPVRLQGHDGIVFWAAFSPDGARVVSAGVDKTARVWSSDGSGEATVLRGHQDAVYSAAFSPDGRRIATGSFDKTARVWNADGTGDPVLLEGHGDRIYSVAFSPDGTRIITASADKTARIWNADGSGELFVLSGHQDWVFSASFSPDGQRIVTTSADTTARVWNADGSGEPVVLRGHQAVAYSAAFSPDGTRVVTGSFDKTARVWNADGTGQPRILPGHGAVLYSATYSRDGDHIVTASWDKTVRVWNARESTRTLILRGHEEFVVSAEMSHDGRRIATGSFDKTARVWNADGSGEPVILRGHDAWIYAASFSPDDKRIVTGSFDKTARIWNADGTGSPVILRGHEDRVYSADFSPDGAHVATASGDKTARVWRADGTGRPVILRGHEDRIYDVGFSPDGLRVVTASFDKTARVWNADGTGEPVILRGHEDFVYGASFALDGTRIATASADRSARVWNADGTGEPVVLRGHEDFVLSARFSPDGAKIVTASADKTARIWNADGTGEPVILSGHEAAIYSASFSPDGAKVVTGSFDKTARVWSDLEPLAMDDPRLWTATGYCMPSDRRQRMLGVTKLLAAAHHKQCLRSVSRYQAPVTR